MKDRIYKIMTELGMNQKEFSEATGISTATLSNIFNGKTKANFNHVKAVCSGIPDLNLMWVLSGEGEMHGKANDVPRSSTTPTLFDVEHNSQPSTGNVEVAPQAEQTVAMEDVLQAVKEVAQHIEKPQRNVVEIRVFFDDGTYDVFSANRK